MKRWQVLACAVALAVAGSVTAGCGASGTAPAEGAVDHTNDWTVPGVLRIESDGGPDNLNPIIGQQSFDTDISMFWCGHFFERSDRDEFVPDLATEVPTRSNGGVSADGLTITYHLRRGVTWQDGAPFDARDVVYTWHAIMDPANDVEVRAGYDLISGIDVKDPYTIAVHLKHPFAPFISTFFAMSNTAYGVLPQHLLARYRELNDVAFDKLPVGTGPYRVVYDDGKTLRMEAYAHYWRGTPHLRSVEFRFVDSSDKALDDLKRHKIDFYYGAYERQTAHLSGIPGTTVYLYPFNSFEDIGFNTASPVVADKRVRQALAYAIDRRELVDHIGSGVNTPADSDQPVFSWAHHRPSRRYRFDLNLAAALLEQAGWHVGPAGIREKGGLPLRITLVSGNGAGPPGPIETLVRQDWRAVGVDVVVKNYDAGPFDAPAAAGGIEASGKFDAVLEGWVNGSDPDDSSQFRCDMRPPAGWNYYAYCDPTLDAAETQAVSSYDQAERKAAYARIQDILADDEPIIVLWFDQQQDVANLDLRNYRPASAATPFWNTWLLEI